MLLCPWWIIYTNIGIPWSLKQCFIFNLWCTICFLNMRTTRSKLSVCQTICQTLYHNKMQRTVICLVWMWLLFKINDVRSDLLTHRAPVYMTLWIINYFSWILNPFTTLPLVGSGTQALILTQPQAQTPDIIKQLNGAITCNGWRLMSGGLSEHILTDFHWQILNS